MRAGKLVPLYPARKSMNIDPKQLTEILEKSIRSIISSTDTNPPSNSSMAPDFIPATHVYDHEKLHQQPQSINKLGSSAAAPVNAFTPVTEPDSVPQTSNPEFVLAPMEADLKEVLRHCLDVENQTLFTVENVLLQQLLRIFQRLEQKLDGLEELITDELLGASKDDTSSENQLLFMPTPDEDSYPKGKLNDEEETEQEKTHSHGTYIESKTANVPRSGGKPPKAKGNARKRRRRKRNGKNKR